VEHNVFVRGTNFFLAFLELLDMVKFDHFLLDKMDNLVIEFDIFVCQNVE
jgi:hypothetical protein